MNESRPRTRGAELARRLQRGCQTAGQALQPGARELAILTGVTPNCRFLEPQENVLTRLGTILVESGRIYRYGQDVVIEMIDGDKRELANLSVGSDMQTNAAALLGNIVTCELNSSKDGSTTQFFVPRELVRTILVHEPTLARLPVINTYAHRPMFDNNFHLCGPGWHADAGYLIHGEDIDPILPDNPADTGDIANRLPPRLRELFADFCFRSDSDRVNAVGALLTGLLVNLFVGTGKAIFILDGNQPSVGKTLFARVFGMVLDGDEPALIKYTSDDEELGKKICANLRGRRSSILLFDNAKLRNNAAIESAVIEANSTAPRISLRILGLSANHEQPNDVIWLITMNGTRLGPDLSPRSCPIRFHFDGNPNGRPVNYPDLVDYARTNRLELLSELAGMVIYWVQQGRPQGTQTHRLGDWCRIIGGILAANGLHGFLDNVGEADADFNTDSDDLAALAEKAAQWYQQGQRNLVRVLPDGDGQDPPSDCGLPAGELNDLYRSAGVIQDRLPEGKPKHARSNIIGAHLSRFLNRAVPVDLSSRQTNTQPLQGVATLRSRPGRARQKLYYFDLVLSPGGEGPDNHCSVPNPDSPSSPLPFRTISRPLSPNHMPELRPMPSGNNLSWN